MSFIYLTRYPLFYADESYYADPAVNFLEEGKFRNSLHSRLPGFEETNIVMGRIFTTVQAGIFKLLGVSVLTIRLQPFLESLACLWLLFGIARMLFEDVKVAVLAFWALALSHVFEYASHSGRPDMGVTFFILLSVFLFLKAQKQGKPVLYFLAGAAAPLAIDMHPTGNIAVFILGGLCLVRLISKEILWRDALFVAGGGVLGVFWWVFWHLLLNWDVFQKQKQFVDVGAPVILNPITLLRSESRRWFSFFWESAGHRNMVLLVLFLCSGVYALRHIRMPSFRAAFALVVSGLIGYAAGAPRKTSFYLPHLYPFLTLLSAAFIVESLKTPGYFKRGLAACLGAAWMALLAGENLYKLKAFWRSDYGAYLAKVKQFIPEGSTVYASETYWPGLRGHARLLGMWIAVMKGTHHLEFKSYEGDFSDLMRKGGVQYLIADEEALNFPSTKEAVAKFIAAETEPAGEMTDDFYGNSLYMSRRPPEPLVTRIYRVKGPSKPPVK